MRGSNHSIVSSMGAFSSAGCLPVNSGIFSPCSSWFSALRAESSRQAPDQFPDRLLAVRSLAATTSSWPSIAQYRQAIDGFLSKCAGTASLPPAAISRAEFESLAGPIAGRMTDVVQRSLRRAGERREYPQIPSTG